MQELAILLRTVYFLKHNCHNLAKGLSFIADHEFLGDSYEETLGHYDDVIERLIGLGQTPNLVEVQIAAANKLKNIPIKYESNTECFFIILNANKMVLGLIEKLCKEPSISQGTIQLIGGIADKIEIENYKLSQRIKK